MLFQLGRIVVQLKLKVVVLGAEQVAVPGGDLARLVLLLERQLLDNLAGNAAGGSDDTLVVLFQQRAVDPRAGKYALVASHRGARGWSA